MNRRERIYYQKDQLVSELGISSKNNNSTNENPEREREV